MSALIEDVELTCPYCGEPMEVDVDCTGGNQTYYEDCHTCCAPVYLDISIDDEGNLVELIARRDNE